MGDIRKAQVLTAARFWARLIDESENIDDEKLNKLFAVFKDFVEFSTSDWEERFWLMVNAYWVIIKALRLYYSDANVYDVKEALEMLKKAGKV